MLNRRPWKPGIGSHIGQGALPSRCVASASTPSINTTTPRHRQNGTKQLLARARAGRDPAAYPVCNDGPDAGGEGALSTAPISNDSANEIGCRPLGNEPQEQAKPHTPQPHSPRKYPGSCKINPAKPRWSTDRPQGITARPKCANPFTNTTTRPNRTPGAHRTEHKPGGKHADENATAVWAEHPRATNTAPSKAKKDPEGQEYQSVPPGRITEYERKGPDWQRPDIK